MGIYGHATLLADQAQQPSPSLLLSVGGPPGTGAYANWISFAYVIPGASLPEAIGTWRIASSVKRRRAVPVLARHSWEDVFTSSAAMMPPDSITATSSRRGSISGSLKSPPRNS